MGDLTQLPFKEDFADFLFCLGVLHHLPLDCLETIRNIKTYAPIFLIYLYYSLDNRPFYFSFLLRMITLLRLTVSKIKNRYFRSCFTWMVGNGIVCPTGVVGENS